MATNDNLSREVFQSMSDWISYSSPKSKEIIFWGSDNPNPSKIFQKSSYSNRGKANQFEEDQL